MREFGKGKTLVQLINRDEFNKLLKKWDIDKKIRRLSTWEQTCTHVMAYLLKLESLREIEAALFVPKSTFSDANRKRCAGFFQDLCLLVLRQIQISTINRRIKRALRLLIIDSSECRVHGSVSVKNPLWHQRKSKGLTKASLKLHAVFSVEGEWVDDFIMTHNRTHDGKACLKFKINPGHVYVFDKAYHDVRFWLNITEKGSHFVTRLKNSPARAKHREKILNKYQNREGVLWEGRCSRHKSNMRLLPKAQQQASFRHIIYRDPETKKVFDFAASDFNCSAQEVADIYKKRWAVELLFRWLKGHLNIRYFAAKNINAIEIQLSVAILVQLLTQLYRIKNKVKATLWECLRGLRIDLLRDGLLSLPRDQGAFKYLATATSAPSAPDS